MARLLYPRDSVSFITNAIRRHQRLCRKTPNGEVFIKAIQPVFKNIIDKNALYEQAQLAREDAYDDVLIADYDLDNIIRNVFDTWKTYTRKHTSEHEVNKIFPDGSFSDIVRMPYADEPNAADAIAASIESLGKAHELFALAAEIRTATATLRKAIDNYKEAIRTEKAADAEVEIVKADIIRAYEINYLDARKILGVTMCERLFPQLSAHTNSKPVEKPVA